MFVEPGTVAQCARCGKKTIFVVCVTLDDINSRRCTSCNRFTVTFDGIIDGVRCPIPEPERSRAVRYMYSRLADAAAVESLDEKARIINLIHDEWDAMSQEDKASWV